jgi:hypothetical protein
MGWLEEETGIDVTPGDTSDWTDDFEDAIKSAAKYTVDPVYAIKKQVQQGTRAVQYVGQELGLIPQMPELPDIEIPEPEPPPTIADTDVRKALEEGRKKRAALAGRQSTIRTTPLGVTQRANVQEKTLTGE